MLRAYKYRIYPSKSQQGKLENTLSICRTLYNNALEHRKVSYDQQGRNVSYQEQQNELPEIKKIFPWYGSVYSLVLQDVLHRVDIAFKNFFRRCKDNSITEKGFPKFKRRGQYNSITYSQHNKYPEGNSRDCSLQVPKIGKIKIRYHRNIPPDADIKTMTVSKEADKWFVCFSVDVVNSRNCSLQAEPKQITKAVGIDMGLIDFFYTSDNDRASAPRLLRLAEDNLKKLQRQLSKLKKGSYEYLRKLKALKKAHYRLKCKRQGFIMEKANELVKQYDVIVHEDLNIKNLVRRPKIRETSDVRSETEEGINSFPFISHPSPFTYLPNGASCKAGLNKSILDAGWGMFFDALNWLAKKAGKTVIAVNAQYTSQQCSNCGVMVKKSLSTRTHICVCGFIANRDFNAAINILRLGLQSLGLAYQYLANPLKPQLQPLV